MERRTGVVSVQTHRAELLWVVVGVEQEDQGLWAWRLVPALPDNPNQSLRHASVLLRQSLTGEAKGLLP